VPRTAAWRPDNDHHTTTQVPNRDDPRFAVVPAIIRKIQRVAAKDLCCIFEVEPRSASVMARLTGSQVILI
jgi:hypothetical protein